MANDLQALWKWGTGMPANGVIPVGGFAVDIQNKKLYSNDGDYNFEIGAEHDLSGYLKTDGTSEMDGNLNFLPEHSVRMSGRGSPFSVLNVDNQDIVGIGNEQTGLNLKGLNATFLNSVPRTNADQGEGEGSGNELTRKDYVDGLTFNHDGGDVELAYGSKIIGTSSLGFNKDLLFLSSVNHLTLGEEDMQMDIRSPEITFIDSIPFVDSNLSQPLSKYSLTTREFVEEAIDLALTGDGGISSTYLKLDGTTQMGGDLELEHGNSINLITELGEEAKVISHDSFDTNMFGNINQKTRITGSTVDFNDTFPSTLLPQPDGDDRGDFFVKQGYLSYLFDQIAAGVKWQDSHEPVPGSEYPDIPVGQEEERGLGWPIQGVDPIYGYDMNDSGDLQGENVNNGDTFLYGDRGWIHVKSTINGDLYLNIHGGNNMHDDLDLGGNKAVRLGEPNDPQDAVTKNYTDVALEGKLNKDGDDMEGTLGLGMVNPHLRFKPLSGWSNTFVDFLDVEGNTRGRITHNNTNTFNIVKKDANEVDQTLLTFQDDGNLSLFGGANEPTSNAHLTRKDYVDNLISNIDGSIFLLLDGSRHMTGSLVINKTSYTGNQYGTADIVFPSDTGTVYPQSNMIQGNYGYGSSENKNIAFGTEALGNNGTARSFVVKVNNETSADSILRVTADSATTTEMYLSLDAHKVWHEGNDGAGSGLDADLLDGSHLTDITSYPKTAQIATTDAGAYYMMIGGFATIGPQGSISRRVTITHRYGITTVQINAAGSGTTINNVSVEEWYTGVTTQNVKVTWSNDNSYLRVYIHLGSWNYAVVQTTDNMFRNFTVDNENGLFDIPSGTQNDALRVGAMRFDGTTLTVTL